MTRTELLRLLQEICGEILEKECAHVNEGDKLTDIGLDSMGDVDLVNTMEKRLKILIPDDYLIGIQSVGQLLDVVEKCDGSRDYWAPERLVTPS
ncbi:acyl carrier protein [Patescibacteria group bacterium]|nr:acyl carrier protein [Patescibacteria group bacterium]